MLIEINNLLVTEREFTAVLKAISESLRRVIEHECVEPGPLRSRFWRTARASDL